MSTVKTMAKDLKVGDKVVFPTATLTVESVTREGNLVNVTYTELKGKNRRVLVYCSKAKHNVAK